jgi:hypothetical protein
VKLTLEEAAARASKIPEDISNLSNSLRLNLVIRNLEPGRHDPRPRRHLSGRDKVKRIRIPEDIIQFTRVFIGLSQIFLAVIKINMYIKKQGFGSGSAWIRIVFGSWIRIRIRVKSWIRNRIKV